FNIDLGQAATFYGSSAIDNVFARVTGGTPSSIDGLLTSAIPGANLWLINPSGVLFGPHASVNVNGSFYVSTADYLKFADGAVFESRLTPAPVLTAAAPEAFGFLGDNPAGITFEGSGSFAAETYLGAKMAVSEGNSLSVVGGDITLTQGKFYGVLDTETRLQAPGGQINLVSISSPGEVSVLDKGMPELSEGIGLGRITIDKGSQVLVNEATNTGIYIKGGEIVIDGAYIFATNFTANDPQPSGDIVIEADNLTLSNEALIAYANGTIAPNGIPLWGQGNNGDIQLSAAKQIALSGNSVIFNNTLGDGNGGSIGISSPSLAIDSSFIQARTIGNGDVGNVDITVDDLLATNGTI
ncbi:MAG: filamentous hemagglutinin N-terminal domain-containing protein, partial [Methylococcales bacterium]